MNSRHDIAATLRVGHQTPDAPARSLTPGPAAPLRGAVEGGPVGLRARGRPGDARDLRVRALPARGRAGRHAEGGGGLVRAPAAAARLLHGRAALRSRGAPPPAAAGDDR